MTEEMLAQDALERKKAWAFLEAAVRRRLLSSPEFRELCREVLAGGRGFREFELDLRGALLGGAAAGVSENLSALDAESGAPACGACGSAMVRRGTRSTAPLSLLGLLTLRRGYWTCGCSKGGRHVLDETLGIAGRDGVRWNAVAELFPNAVCIVDIWHAKERLWEVGRAVYGAGTELCRAWSEKVCAALSEGRVDDVLRELRRHAGDKTADQCAGYFENNRGRMRYPAYRKMGLLIGSGMVESSCRTLVGERLKCSGMRWSRAGANDVMALRSCVRSGRYDDFWRRRRKPPRLAARRLAH